MQRDGKGVRVRSLAANEPALPERIPRNEVHVRRAAALRRLTPSEYWSSVSDLLGLDATVSAPTTEDVPAISGFKNVAASTLTISAQGVADEVARVRETLPEVFVPEWPEDKMSYRAALLSLGCFDRPRITEEDKRRTEMYAGEARRNALKADVGSLDEWLRSLEIRVRAEPLKPENLARISQLINKTNQMNLRTRRMSEAELAAWATRPGHAAWGFTVDDRFGSSGLTGVVGLRYQGGSAFFEDFVLSCRVIGRRIEETMVHFACRAAREAACREIRAEYLPTAKNSPCLEFWMRSGLDRMGPDYVFVRDLGRDYPLPSVVTLS